MGRTARKYSEAEYWHIMLRGIGHMNLFFDNEDYERFEQTIFKYKKELNVSLYAYCLMGNHTHLLMGTDTDTLKLLFKKIEVSYSYYYNHKYEHAGHLFQNRYKSEPIFDENYLLSALRYILRNPEAAGICNWDNYSHSSAAQYLGLKETGITDTEFITSILGESEKIREFMTAATDISLAEPENAVFPVKDDAAVALIAKLTGTDNPLMIQKMRKNERNAALIALKQAGLSNRQIERLTGINRNIVQRAQ